MKNCLSVSPESESCRINNPCESKLTDIFQSIKTGSEYGFYNIIVYAKSTLGSTTVWSEVKELTFINAFLGFSGLYTQSFQESV